MFNYKTIVPNKGVLGQRNAARLQISMNNPKHTGEKFASLTTWAKQKFDTVVISLADTLYRHNLVSEGMPWEEAREKARKMGDEWLKINTCALTGTVITRWDDWITGAEFKNMLYVVENAINQSPQLSEQLSGMIDSYLKRQKSELFLPKTENIRSYFIEELAVFALQQRELEACDVYAGTPIPIFDLVRNFSPVNVPKEWHSIYYTQVDFIRSKENIKLAA